MNQLTEDSEDNILYELLVYSEWCQDPDVILQNKTVESFYQRPWKLLAGYLKNLSGAYYISEWVNQQLPWLFAVGAEGKAVAVLQDSSLEIRTSRDSYSTPIGKAFLNKDLHQAWRKLQWSPDGTLLACAQSNGSVDVYDLLATHLFVIPPSSKSGINPYKNFPESAIAGLVFVDTRTKHAHWSYELLCIDYYGQLRAFYVSPTQGFMPSHTFSFSSQLPSGITTVCADHQRNLLILASPVNSEIDSDNNEGITGTQCGLSIWRLIDDSPFYHYVPTIKDKNRLQKRWLKSFKKGSYEHSIVRMSSSVDGSRLAAIHFSGAVSVWALPSLSSLHFWALDHQPGFDELSPALLQLSAARRVRSSAFQNPFKFHPVDINWWSNQSVILARCSGAVSVCGIDDLNNKLGSSAEFFDGSPRIGPCYDKTFLGLECEVKVQRKRLQVASEDDAFTTEDSTNNEDLSDDEETSDISRRMIRSILYWITDSERFQPPRKRPKLLARTYRLLGFKRTTPEELYLWKLDAEEYGEALALARVYNLDCDLVYQRQWRNTSASIPAIQDYLSKVGKRNWVLRECLERVPNDVDAARELLVYGLKNTDLAVVAGVSETSQGKCYALEQHDQELVETDEEINRRQEERTQKLLATIDFDHLTVEQKMLISTRHRLLLYLDRLSMYEMILGGPHAAGERFDAQFFETFRTQSAFVSTMEFAHRGEWQAVATMFTFQGNATLPHRLVVCSSFPETLPPYEYRSVLPECDVTGDVFLWQQLSLRDADWSELDTVKTAIDMEHVLEMEAVDQFYNSPENSKLKALRTDGVELTTDLVSSWYCLRAADIEKQSQLVDHSLDLIKLGLERNVPHLEVINHHLLTLETLVYDLQYDYHFNLEKLNSMSELSVALLIMSKCTEDTFLHTFNRWLMPYLRRLDALHPGRIAQLLRDLLLTRSSQHLGWALQVSDNSKVDKPNAIITDAAQLISLALDCIYACQSLDQLEIAMKIYDCLPERPKRSRIDPQLTKLHDQLDLLQSHLEAADILEHHDIRMTPTMIATKQKDPEQTEQLFIRLTRTAMRKTQSLADSQWKEILQDMLVLQKKVFHCISPQLCYEILVGSLLSCARKESITWAGSLLQLDPNRVSSPQHTWEKSAARSFDLAVIPFERSKELIMQAAEEYFNSSENFSDPSLQLSSYCLGLISVNDEQIQREKDLLPAIEIMADYGLDMPPLQIRLSQNRLLFIDQVLKQGKKAYKNPPRLLRLAFLLRACKGDQKEIEAEVYVRIAQTALHRGDLEVAGQMCTKLRLGNHSIGWQVSSKLAQLEDYTDLDMKMELVSFALVYCPPESIEELLQVRWHLERDQLHGACTRQLEMYMTYQNGNESLLQLVDKSCVNAYRHNVDKMMQNKEKMSTGGAVLQTTAATTKQLVHAVKNSLKLKDEGKSERQMTNATAPTENNQDCTRFGLPVFYWNVWCDLFQLHESSLSVTYQLFSLPDSCNNELNLLTWSRRMQVLNNLDRPYATCHTNDQIVTRLVESVFPQDCLLALGYLFDLNEPEKAWESFTRLPSTELTLQSAAYYFALQVERLRLDQTHEGGVSQTPAVTTVAPQKLIERCINLDESCLSAQQISCRMLLKRALHLLADVSEAQQLRRLDGGVDINRFTTDDGYKQDTIVGLAITTDASIYTAAVRLAVHYGVSTWQVAFSHLTALFAEESIQPDLLTRYMKEHKMQDTLLQDVTSFSKQMVDVIYPNISGRDHDRLKLFFEILNSHPQMERAMQPNAQTYLDILQKLKSVPVVDVKKLMRSTESFVKEIESVLDADSVGKFAKLAKLISSSTSEQGSAVKILPASVHSVWAQKYFFQLADPGVSSKAPTAADWLHRFETCKNQISKLNPSEFTNLIDGLCFSDQSLDLLTVDVRSEICHRALKMAKQKFRPNKKEHEEDQEIETSKLRLHRWSQHLERLGSQEYCQFRRDIENAGPHFWRAFERSRAEEKALHHLLLSVLIQQQPIQLLQLFISIYPVDCSWAPQDILIDAIRLTLDYLRNANVDGGHLLADIQPMQVLSYLLIQVSDMIAQDGPVSESDVEELLQEFYQDDSVDVNARLQLLEMMPAQFTGAMDQSADQIQLLRTLALIRQTWDADDDVVVWSQQLTKESVDSEDQRLLLFTHLLDTCQTGAHLRALAKLLHFWPAFSSSDNPMSAPWTVLWQKLVQQSVDNQDTSLTLDSLLLALEQKPPLSNECIRFMYDTAGVLANNIRLRLHIGLKSRVDDLENDSIRLLDDTAELSAEDYDEDILNAIIKRGLVGRIVTTQLYNPLCEQLLSLPADESHSAASIEGIAHQLIDYGHRAEAGHLLQLTSGLPRYLLNFSSALYFARKKL